MDKLITNIQQSFNKMNTDGILKNQQISQDKINELLEKTAESMVCGPSCQRQKISDELKQKYLDAKTNIQTAPINLEETKKNFYVYTKGRPYYDNMKEEELKQTVNNISTLIINNFNDELSNTNTMNSYLNTALINSSNTEDLLNEYLNKNKMLKLKLRETHGDILTNDRKTYYETEAYDRLVLWYRLLWYIYYITIIILILSLILSENKLNNVSKIIIVILLVFYPYYISYIIKWFYENYQWMKSKIPKNIYNDL